MTCPAVRVEVDFRVQATATTYATWLMALIATKPLQADLGEGQVRQNDAAAGSAPYVVSMTARTQTLSDADDVALQAKNKWLDPLIQPDVAAAGAWRHSCYHGDAAPQACVETKVYSLP